MPRMVFGLSAYRRDNGNMPEVRVVNMHAEEAPTAEGGVTLMSRKGLTEHSEVGAGPIQGLFQEEGTFGGDVFAVSGGSLYRGSTLLGAIDGSGAVSFASSGLEILVTAGASAWSYNGTNLAAVAFPDGADVTAVDFAAGLFLYARAGSHKFYWSAVLDGRTVDALDFASAESSPDPLVDIKVVRGNPYMIGQSTIEPFFPTGDPDLPFSPIQQRIYSKGAIGTGCSAELDNTLCCIGSDATVWRFADVPEPLSDAGIEERIKGSSTRRAFGFMYEGHPFFCIRLDDGCFIYDARTKQWNNPSSYGRDLWRASCAIDHGTGALLGDDEDGRIWEFSGYEDAGATFERLFTAGFRMPGGAISIDRLNVEANVGWTELLSGQGSDPEIEMRFSRDGGATFSSWDGTDMGAQGEYRTRPEWRALGMFDAPGALFEFRVTDPVPFRVSGVYYNEPAGGRSR